MYVIGCYSQLTSIKYFEVPGYNWQAHGALTYSLLWLLNNTWDSAKRTCSGTIYSWQHCYAFSFWRNGLCLHLEQWKEKPKISASLSSINTLPSFPGQTLKKKFAYWVVICAPLVQIFNDLYWCISKILFQAALWELFWVQKAPSSSEAANLRKSSTDDKDKVIFGIKTKWRVKGTAHGNGC